MFEERLVYRRPVWTPVDQTGATHRVPLSCSSCPRAATRDLAACCGAFCLRALLLVLAVLPFMTLTPHPAAWKRNWKKTVATVAIVAASMSCAFVWLNSTVA